MRIDLLVLAVLAAGALAALVESARVAARSSDAGAVHGSAVTLLRAMIEDLERERASIDDQGPRLLFALGGTAAVLALACAGCSCAELAAILVAVALGLAAPGVSWSCEQRRRAAELTLRIAELRSRLEPAHVAPRARRGSV